MSLSKKKHGGLTCCVPGCTNNTMTSRHVSWHGFPKNEEDRKVWIKRINRRQPGKQGLWVPSPYQKICGAHFNVSGRRAYLDRFPTIFPHRKYKQTPSPYSWCKPPVTRPWSSLEPEAKPEANPEAKPKAKPGVRLEASLQANHPAVVILLDKVPSNLREECQSSLGAFVELPSCSHVPLPTPPTRRRQSHITFAALANLDHPYAAKGVVENVILAEDIPEPPDKKKDPKDIQEENDSLKHINEDLEARLELMEKLLQAQKFKTATLQQTIINKSYQKDLSVTALLEDEKCLKFYTGFSSKDRFRKFLKFVKGRAKGHEPSSGRTGRPTSLSIGDQIATVLCRLRLGLLEEDLGFRFGVSASTVSRLLTFWTPLLCELLEEIAVWPIPEAVLESLPEALKTPVATTEDISLECSEILLQVPADWNVQCDAYEPTVKRPRIATALVGMAQNGYVCFVSDLTLRSTTDSDGANSGTGGCEPGRAAIAAGGDFEAADDPKNSGVRPRKRRSAWEGRMSQEDEEHQTKVSGSLKVHINRVVHELKRFKILKCMSMSEKLNTTWKLCCYLTNFTRDPAQVK
ncbi:uncharacterized protein LOC115330700 isoform X2 [Ixodes scapularis]|uniref:uncharacterized protein LOC115330700 isoform X2 n=1 Tax=Ixodes scapularis TaxID=6945 RepID=UPI001A9F694F|nr:uncharacterized protein LOC115330700 isoform X2 [Ixodes scapularis]